MRVLITGANGFLGRNLIDRLENMLDMMVLPFHYTDDLETLRNYCHTADFVFHLAAISRPEDTREFKKVNVDYFEMVLDCLETTGNKCTVLLTSSVQAAMEGRFSTSEYGRSKAMAEDLLISYGNRTGANVMFYRLPHVFGKWGRPYYNNVVHTFCHNIANGKPLMVNDPEVRLELLWVEDLVDDMVRIMQEEQQCGLLPLPVTYHCTLGRLAEILGDIHNGKVGVNNDFENKLSLTLQSY